MNYIIGLLMTYAAFGCFLYGRYLDNDLGELFKAALRGIRHRPGGYWYLAAIALAVIGALIIIIPAVKPKKKY